MREVRIKVAEKDVQWVLELARAAGADRVSETREILHDNGVKAGLVVLAMESSTPTAQQLVDRIEGSGLLQQGATMTIRELRAVVSSEPEAKLTVPLPTPGRDVVQDLWMLSHLTMGHLARAAVASGLLAYGLIRNHILVIAAGLLFLPTLPQLLAIARGLRPGARGLLLHGVRSLVATMLTLLGMSVAIGFAVGKPVSFQGFSSPTAGFVMAVGIGAAAALATIDDVGRRELIGLATASQFAPTIADIGVQLGCRGAAATPHFVLDRARSACVSIMVLIASATATYAILRVVRRRVSSPGLRADRRES